MRKTEFVLGVLVLLAAVWAGCDSGGGSDPSDGGADADTDTDADSDTDTDPEYTWSEELETFWGEGPSLDDRVELFELSWGYLADEYACFETLGLDWDAVHDEYLALVQAAESYGRFAQVMAKLSDDLKDPHTYLYSQDVCMNDVINERPPIELTGVSSVSSILGACVAATDDGELVVYRVDPDTNPLGLAVGDEIIGYDDKPWDENMEDIDAASLPICGRTKAVPSVLEYSRRASVLMNAHLFSTLQLRRTGRETETVDLIALYDDVLPGQEKAQVLCTNQLPVDGMDFPLTTKGEIGVEDNVTWGTLPGTNIGYIYVYQWMDADAALFEQAVEELYDTDALIIDQRFNLGGRYTLVDYGMPILFSEDTPAVDFYMRDDSGDYTGLELWFETDVVADTETSYDKPIAVLMGPDAMSGGDLFPYVMAKHPRARLFGMPTSGAFGGITYPFMTDPILGDFTLMLTNSAMIEPTTGEHLEGHENTPDTPVWLTKADILAGQDTVVTAALDWIDAEI